MAEGGFGSYVKPYKPWFIGRDAYVAREKERKGVVIRFTFDEQRVRMAHNGDPVVNANGERIGFVTSCAIDGHRFITGQAFRGLWPMQRKARRSSFIKAASWIVPPRRRRW